MRTQTYFDKEARNKMKTGVDILANAVKCTLGPGGRHVAFRPEMPPHTPKITKDGVTVTRWIHPIDKMEAMGADLVKMAAEKTAISAGDGTTTSTLLAQVMIHEGLSAVENGGNAVDIKRGMDKAVAIVVESLKKQSRPVADDNLVNIATIAANNEKEIGELVADAIKKTGDDGVIYLQNGKTPETHLELTEGIQVDRGYISQYFVTNPAKMTVELDNALILFSERKISILKDIQHLLEIVLHNKKSLLIIAEDVDGEALATLVKNRLEGGVKWAAIKQPGFGNMQLQMFEDIAVMCGGKVVSQTMGQAWNRVDETFFGKADKIIISSTTTSIIGAKGKKSDVVKRIESIRALINNAPNDHEKEKLKISRLAKLTNGVGIIHVGGQTEVEMNEKKDRIDDAICATRAAKAEGVLPGGGTAYIRAISALPEVLEGGNKDQNEGLRIIRAALSAPLNQIALNVGESGETVVNNVAAGTGDYGYNAKTNQYEDMYVAGIIDPTKVSRTALENAESVAAMFLTTQCAIVDVKPDK